MPKKGQLLTKEQYSNAGKISISSVVNYGSLGMIKRKKVDGKFKYIWGSFKYKPKPEYKCEKCGGSELDCGKMMIVKFIEEFLASLEDYVQCEC